MQEMSKRPRQLPRLADELQAAFWSVHSWTWDSLFPNAVADRWAADLLAWFRTNGAVPPARILDLGCATGRYSRAFAAAGFEVIGLDFAPGMLQRARAAAQSRQLDIAFQRANLNASLSISTESIDHALCRGVLQCITNPPLLVAEIRRVLRPGGLLNIGVKPDPLVGEMTPGTTWGSRAFARFKRIATERAQLNRFTAEGLRSLLSASGFHILEDRGSAAWIELLARAAS